MGITGNTRICQLVVFGLQGAMVRLVYYPDCWTHKIRIDRTKIVYWRTKKAHQLDPSKIAIPFVTSPPNFLIAFNRHLLLKPWNPLPLIIATIPDPPALLDSSAPLPPHPDPKSVLTDGTLAQTQAGGDGGGQGCWVGGWVFGEW